MDVKPVYANLQSVAVTLAADEARLVWRELESLITSNVLDASTNLGQLHQSLGTVSEVAQ